MTMEKARLRVQQFRQREQSILDAALALLLEQGEDKVTVELIAATVDIGKGTIYKHFTSKSEIYLRLMFDDLRILKDQMGAAIEQASSGADYTAPAKVYFSNRMSDPVRARLFQRLEEKLIASGDETEKLAELSALRESTLQQLNRFFTERIDAGQLNDVSPYYYNLTYWALTHGAVELFHNSALTRGVEDMEGLMNFIMDVGVNIGLKPKG